ncbi:MAG TPA: 6-phosphofructokinase [Candidatus Ornithomonoglobus intestinigallinarum]|uniref:ATP-dependent 6-phosphofructokinase n=1 Tax=Candidatus Ornithomonoglobus intestinigallinarum TaxID=2840894 RepID=A0A9D1H3Z3_9FIRM|nr:6-phosphofructokinase [Candidatus Ornithomonoglobus intestinigallinarum]
MERNIRTIGVLTSGGDAPGMNAAIRAVVRTGAYYGVKVVGVRRGYNGLINGELETLDARSVSGIIQRGGTMLQTARCLEFKEKEGVRKAVSIARVFGLDGLVVIGGDGSFRGAKDLCAEGLPTIAMPGTIDNDINCSEYTVGFDTCLNTVMEAVDKLRDTAQSHERCSVIEVMGRAAGYIALDSGIACGADVVLIPEKEWSFDDDVLRPILESKQRGKRHSIVVVAEGIGGAMEMAKEIEEKTGIESRATILGHVQRGGSPTVRDRVVASEMGAMAVELLLQGKQNRIVCMRENKIVDVDIEEGLNMKKHIPPHMIELAKKLAI